MGTIDFGYFAVRTIKDGEYGCNIPLEPGYAEFKHDSKRYIYDLSLFEQRPMARDFKSWIKNVVFASTGRVAIDGRWPSYWVETWN